MSANRPVRALAAHATRIPWRRGGLTAFVGAHRVVWDSVGALLTIVYVVLAFREESATPLENVALWVLAAVFLAEFAARCYDAPSRLVYLRGHWLDLVTAIPVPGIPGLRVFRLLRLLRFAKIGIYVRRILVAHGMSGASLIWPSLFLFWIGSSAALWLYEHDAPGTVIKTFPDAMLAAFLTASTLGFAKHSVQAVTEGGEIISAAIVFAALGLWGFASSRLTDLWLHGRADKRDSEMAEVRDEVRHLRVEIARLGDLLRSDLHYGSQHDSQLMVAKRGDLRDAGSSGVREQSA